MGFDLCSCLTHEEIFNTHTVSKTGKNFFRRNPGKGKAGGVCVALLHLPPGHSVHLPGKRKREEGQRRQGQDAADSAGAFGWLVASVDGSNFCHRSEEDKAEARGRELARQKKCRSDCAVLGPKFVRCWKPISGLFSGRGNSTGLYAGMQGQGVSCYVHIEHEEASLTLSRTRSPWQD